MSNTTGVPISKNDFFVNYQPIDVYGNGLGFVADSEEAKSLLAKNDRLSNANVWRVVKSGDDVHLVASSPVLVTLCSYIVTEKAWEYGDEHVLWLEG